MSKKEVITPIERKIEKIWPEKFKFLDEYDSLKIKLNGNLKNFTSDEWCWFYKTFKSKKNKERDVSFLAALPVLIRNKDCVGFLSCLVKEPGIMLADIARKMGIFSRRVQIAKEKLEQLELVVIHREPITEVTKCYLNDGEIKRNGYPPIPNILNIALKMMEEKHGRDQISKLISIEKDIQKEANRKHMQKKRKKS